VTYDPARAFLKTLPLAPLRLREWVALSLIAVTSAFLNLFRLGQNGYGSAYYAAAVKSMLSSWHNLFFVAFDPAGFESVDKPPLGFWLQALSARIFGFSGLSLLVPQALLGIVIVLLVFHLVRRSFGPGAGLLAGAMMALTPISVATSRSNHLDVALTLTLVLAAWAAIVATETGRLRALLWSAAIVGVGFNVKMLEAYLVVPALGILYLATAPLGRRLRATHLALSVVVLASVSISWALVVDLTPAELRPHIDSSESDSELALAFGYNGVNRLLYAGAQAPSEEPHSPRPLSATSRPTEKAPDISPLSLTEIGARGPRRLLALPLAPQIGWWIPLALFGGLALLWQKRWSGLNDATQRAILLWGVWLLTTLVVFSGASFFHPYYLVTMAPPICALSSVGFVALYRDHRDRPARDPRGLGLTLVLPISAFFEAGVLMHYPGWSRWMSPVVLGLGVFAAGVLLTARACKMRGRLIPTFLSTFAAGAGFVALLFPPLVWSLNCLAYVPSSDKPSGGPQQGSLKEALEEARRAASQASTLGLYKLAPRDEPLLHYVEANHLEEKFLLGSLFSNRISAQFILATGQAVMSLGGYRGSAPILKVDELASYIESGQIRFFALPLAIKRRRDEASGPGEVLAPLEGKNAELVQWIATSCETVPAERWHGWTGEARIGGVPVRDRLFDCKNLRGENSAPDPDEPDDPP
jgi:4-amino-4-deoxy-L-arabinose transferase-like glycosyltransferase